MGVDIFFVISGFLISSLILDRLKNATFSFTEFYGRRIRRLFPALTVVLLTVLVLGWFALPPAEYVALGRNTLAGAAFVANIQTYSEVGYFDAPAATKPLLHLWSLGVEEQFYFVFPALLLFFWRHRAIALSFALLGIISFGLNIVLVRSHPSFTFYFPLTRFWEFIAGGLLALGISSGGVMDIASIFASTSARRDIFAAIGAALIIAGVSFASDELFPGWWGLLPVVGSFLLIGAGPRAWINRKILGTPGLVYIGLISYPLYLWHWPLLVIGRTIMGDYENQYARTTTVVAVVLAFILSWLTYQFIERPVRARKPAFPARNIVATCSLSLAAVALLGFAVVLGDGFVGRYPEEVQPLMTPPSALADLPPEDESKNSAGPLLVAYGDSHANHLLGGLRSLQNERTFRLTWLNWGHCTPMILLTSQDDDETCRKLASDKEKVLKELSPDIVVVGALWRSYQHVEKIGEMLRFLQRIGVRRIVVIGEVPIWSLPLQQMLYRAYKADPLHKIPDRLSTFETDPRGIERQLKDITSSLGVTFISAHDVLCNENGCLTRLGSTASDLVQVDNHHLSAAGSRFLINHIANKIFD